VRRTRTRPIAAGLTRGLVSAAIVVAFCYWAEVVALTLIVSVLLAFLLDPLVERLVRPWFPRALATLVVILLVTAALGGAGILVWNRASETADEWPQYRATLQGAVTGVVRDVEGLLEHLLPVTDREASGGLAMILAEERPLRAALLHGLGSLYSVLWIAAFVPFLVFFMLSEKPALWEASLELFSARQRPQVRRALEELNRVLRGYIVGNLGVLAILVLANWLFFWAIGLDYPFLGAVVSGVVNLVPYFGAVLAWVPPFLVGLSQWSSIGPFLGVAAMLTLFHLVAINALFPALVGRSVRVNALSVTLALLFWGWLWGGIGLLLAIPIVATIKVVCDHVEPWRPVGRWLGA
jgi:predicted PurR-regulated permease PerM